MIPNHIRVSVLSLTLGMSTLANGFGSEPPRFSPFKFGDPNHELITQEALAPAFRFTTKTGKTVTFGAAELGAIRLANASADNQNGNLNSPEFHFDEDSFQRSAENLYQWQRVIIQKAKSGDYALAREHLGRALHLVQDFYSHTNWVELKISNPTTPVPALGTLAPFGIIAGLSLAGGATCARNSPIPNIGLTSGWFDNRMFLFGTDNGWYTNEWIALGHAWPSDKCVHGNPNASNLGSGLNKDTQSRAVNVKNDTTLNGGFYSARAFAVKATEDYMYLLLAELDKVSNDAAICGLMTESTPNAVCTNTVVTFLDTFDGPFFDAEKWTVSTVSAPCCGPGNPAIYYVSAGQLNITVPGGSCGVCGVGDGSAFRPKVPGLIGDFEIYVSVQELSRTNRDGTGKTYSAVSLELRSGNTVVGVSAAGDVLDNSGLSGHVVRIAAEGAYIGTRNLTLRQYYSLEFRITRISGTFYFAYKVAGDPDWTETSRAGIPASLAMTPQLVFFSGDGGGTRTNSSATFSVDTFSIKQ